MALITKRSTLSVIFILACAIALLFWWRTRGQPTASDGRVKSDATTPASVSTHTTAGDTPGATTPASQPAPPPTQKPSVELRRTFETLNHNEIEFYGRAVDQFGGPVAAADVQGTVIVNTGTRSGGMHRKTTTDAQGYFQFSGFKGQDLGIGISKEGYEYRRHESSFSYSYFEADHKRHIPDPKNPVIFTLWKKQGAESLIQYNTMFWNVPADGTSTRIDLATGKMGSSTGDLIITLEREPLKMRFGERGYRWMVVIEVIGGGLIDAGERDYYNIAPETGYEPRFEYTQEPQSIRGAQQGKIKWSWQGDIKKIFFIKSLDGSRYAFLRLSISSSGRDDNDTVGSVGIGVWLNPNGSRNLEFDPAKAIRPKLR